MGELLKAVGIRKAYRTGDTELDVLKGIDLRLSRGEIAAVVGPSGAGKSTFLHILGGLDRPNEGAVWIESTDVYALSDIERARFRNRDVGFVFQFHHLLNDFTALENVMMPLLIRGQSPAEARRSVVGLLLRMGLEARMDHFPSELSGGECQRVAMARALATRPKLLLADEPSGNLDAERSAELHDLIWDLARRFEQTVLLVTHDGRLAERSDRIIRMEDGRIESSLPNGV